MQTAAAVILAALACTACSDDWDDHYEEKAAANGTLWSAISADPTLSNFAKVLQATGYSSALDGSQTFSVFAPNNTALSEESADSLIEAYNSQKQSGVKDDDNTVIRQFVQNHLALYTHPVSSLTNDTITLMNGKYEPLTTTAVGGQSLLSSNQLYNNGLLFTLGTKISYFPSVFEYLGIDNDIDSTYNFINAYSTYTFDPSKSVAGGVVNGQTVYLDSVTTMTNSLMTRTLGEINQEDSTYWMVVPTNSEWTRLLNEYSTYFDYREAIEKRDSMQWANSRIAILYGTVFSRSINPDRSFQDSAVSTQANSYATDNLLYGAGVRPGVFYKPFESGGVFDGTTSVECSNGRVLKASNFNIDKRQTFLQEIKIEAENIRRQDTITAAIDPLTVVNVPSTSPFYDKISNNQYVQIEPYSTGTGWANPSVIFSVPDVFSNIPYDVYVVLAPAIAGDSLASDEDRLPSHFRAQAQYRMQNGGWRKGRRQQITATPDVVDTVFVETITFPTCSYGLTDPELTITLTENVTRTQTNIYSRNILVDCIILKPHEETATEAKRHSIY